jgi:hypothetical protein
MKIQINSDKQVKTDEAFGRAARESIGQALERFKDRVTRVEVHLSDINSASKPGLADKRCAIEARPAGEKPVSVVHTAATVEQAMRGATGKLKRLFTSRFGKADRAVRRSPAQPAGSTKKVSAASAGKKAATKTAPTKRAAAKEAPSKIAKPAGAAKRKTTRRAEPAADGRSPKKKKVFQARRKAHPKRTR